MLFWWISTLVTILFFETLDDLAVHCLLTPVCHVCLQGMIFMSTKDITDGHAVDLEATAEYGQCHETATGVGRSASHLALVAPAGR